MANQGRHVVQTLDRTDDVGANLRMATHPGHLVFRKRHRLPENPVWDSDFADVMEDGPEANGGGLVTGEPHALGTGARQFGQPFGVATCVAVLGLDGIRQRHVDFGHQLGLDVPPRHDFLVRRHCLRHHGADDGDDHEQEEALQDDDALVRNGGEVGPILQRRHRAGGQVEHRDQQRAQNRRGRPESQRGDRDDQEEEDGKRTGVPARGVRDHGRYQHVDAGGRIAEGPPGAFVQEEQQQGRQADNAPGGKDAVDPAHVVAGCGIEVVEDDGEDQQRPAKQTGEPLIAEIDQTLGRILGALAGLAHDIAGGGHCRNYQAAL